MGDTVQFSRFSYAKDNPVTNIDPNGRSACPGSSRVTCIQSDSYDSSRSTGQTTQASQPVREAMIAGKNVVAVPAGGTKEKIGFVTRQGGNGYTVTLATNATTSSTARTDSASAIKPAGAEAVIHGHIDGRSDGVISPADAAPLTAGLPNGVVSEGRVGVTEIIGGRLQFQMLEGKMTQRESREMQKSLDKQQRQPEFMQSEATP